MNTLRAVVGPTPGPGHGECFVWKRDADDTVVAVDAGGAASVGKYAGGLNPEILILSHDDNDHIRGAVGLINSAKASLRELWIPAEWAILIKQIARTGPNDLLPDGSEFISIGEVEAGIADQIGTTPEPEGGNLLSFALLAMAGENLSSWDVSAVGPNQGFSLASSSPPPRHWYGAKDLGDIIRRVRFRARTLIAILTAALTNTVRIRYFSIDLALSSTDKKWETEGRAGTATLANASEAPHSLAVQIPPGLPYTFALTQLTVQNRRALCTLLWSDPSTPDHGTAIWSDSDGVWLEHSIPLGLGHVIGTLRASSAPHHASANAAHDRIWMELRNAPSDLVMVNAGGNSSQSYRLEYLTLRSRRCCTWCRPLNTTYQEVRVTSGANGQMFLHDTCLISH